MPRIALLIVLLLAVIPASRGDEQQPNLCFETERLDWMPLNADAFAALKQDCNAGNHDAWVIGWRCHPSNNALAHCPFVPAATDVMPSGTASQGRADDEDKSSPACHPYDDFLSATTDEERIAAIQAEWRSGLPMCRIPESIRPCWLIYWDELPPPTGNTRSIRVCDA